MFVADVSGKLINLDDISLIEMQQIDLNEWGVFAMESFSLDSPWFLIQRSADPDDLARLMIRLANQHGSLTTYIESVPFH